MAATKITVRNNGSVKVEGDFEVVDQEGKPYGLAGRTAIALVPLRPFRAEAFLRRLPQEDRVSSSQPRRLTSHLLSRSPELQIGYCRSRSCNNFTHLSAPKLAPTLQIQFAFHIQTEIKHFM